MRFFPQTTVSLVTNTTLKTKLMCGFPKKLISQTQSIIHACFQLMSGSISRGGMTTIERQFQVDTKQVSSLPVFYTSCKLPLILVSSYLGRKYSR